MTPADGAPRDVSAWVSGDPNYRVIRGGSWRNESELVRTAVRVDRNIHVRFGTLGLRIARTMNRRSSSVRLMSAIGHEAADQECPI